MLQSCSGVQLGFVVCNHYYALPVRVNLHAIAMKILHRPLDLVAVEEARSHVAPPPSLFSYSKQLAYYATFLLYDVTCNSTDLLFFQFDFVLKW